MNRLVQTEGILLKGKSLLSAWESGVLSGLLATGLSLEEARKQAEKLGALIWCSLVENLIVTDGKELVGDILIDEESAGLTYHALGTNNTTPVVGDSQLGSEQARKTWTSRTRSGVQLTLSVFYLASECTYAIKECGVFGGASTGAGAGTGVLFSHYLQTFDNSGGSVDLTFDYLLTIG